MKKKMFFTPLLALVLFFLSQYGFSQTTTAEQLLRQDEQLATVENLLVRTLGKNNLLVEQLKVSSTKIENLNLQLQDSASKLGVLEVQLQTAQQNLNKSNSQLTQAQNQLQTSEQTSKEQLVLLDQADKSIKRLETENLLIKLVGGGLIVGLGVIILIQNI